MFMKGTNNLLRFSINEFLIDYINHIKHHLSGEAVDNVVKMLSAHQLSCVEVQEYWDQTEYMNISAVTSKYS